MKKNFSHEQLLEMLGQMKKQVPRPNLHEMNNVGSTGDYIYNCKNSFGCFDVKELEDCGHSNNCVSIKDSMDMSNTYYKSELNYQVMSAMNIYNCNYCVTCFDSNDLDHCEHLYNSHDCFGCFSMKNAEYCIFNEQYSKEEYFKKVEQIKKEMMGSGEYMKFPSSTYPYEDSNAAMHWPIESKQFNPN